MHHGARHSPSHSNRDRKDKTTKSKPRISITFHTQSTVQGFAHAVHGCYILCSIELRMYVLALQGCRLCSKVRSAECIRRYRVLKIWMWNLQRVQDPKKVSYSSDAATATPSPSFHISVSLRPLLPPALRVTCEC